MTDYRGAWSAGEVEEFLDGADLPLRLACVTDSGRLWMVSLWFRPRDGELWCATPRAADVVGFIEGNSRVAFEVSTNRPPYRGVRGNGRATVDPDTDKALLRELIGRYLGGTDSELARTLLDENREEVRIRIDPERVASWDFTDRMRDA